MSIQNSYSIRLSTCVIAFGVIILIVASHSISAQKEVGYKQIKNLSEPIVSLKKHYFLEEDVLITVKLRNRDYQEEKDKNNIPQKFHIQLKGVFDENDQSIRKFTYKCGSETTNVVPVENGFIWETGAKKLCEDESSVSLNLAKAFQTSLGVSEYKLILTFEDGQMVNETFQIVFDEEKSTSILASKLKSQSDADQNWAFSNLLKFNKVKLILLLEEMQTSEDSSQRTRASSLLNQLKVNKLY